MKHLPNPTRKTFEEAREELLANLQARVNEMQSDIDALRAGQSINGKWVWEMLDSYELLVTFIRSRRLKGSQ